MANWRFQTSRLAIDPRSMSETLKGRSMTRTHNETHLIGRIGWLRAAVLRQRPFAIAAGWPGSRSSFARRIVG
jgi:hypothetical protein